MFWSGQSNKHCWIRSIANGVLLITIVTMSNRVQSGKKWSSLKLEMETGKKTGLYSLAPPDHSPVQSLGNWDWTVQSNLKTRLHGRFCISK